MPVVLREFFLFVINEWLWVFVLFLFYFFESIRCSLCVWFVIGRYIERISCISYVFVDGFADSFLKNYKVFSTKNIVHPAGRGILGNKTYCYSTTTYATFKFINFIVPRDRFDRSCFAISNFVTQLLSRWSDELILVKFVEYTYCRNIYYIKLSASM